MIDNENKKIDEFLHIRNKGMYDYSKATSELIKMGVKIGKNLNGNITIPKSFGNFLHKYEKSNLEFEWQVVYENGMVLNQFEDDGRELNFKDIIKDGITSISYISNFSWPTANKETRVIVRLNWKTGLFEVLNGFMDQNTRTHLLLNPLKGERKLILFARKRLSSTTGDLNNEYKEFAFPTEETFFYNRFILGYEAGGEKKMCIIEPNGNIKIFQN